jgi:putative NADH-flavin reductase
MIKMNKTKLTSLLVLLLILVLAGTYVYADTIVVYGATGKIGSKIVTEALDREHKVIGVSRNPKNLTIDHQNFSAVAGDVSSLESVLETIQGVDAVILSVRGYGPNNYPEETLNNRSSKTFIAASRQIGDDAPRVIHLGGGSTLYSNGVLGLDAQPKTEGTLLHGLIWGHWLALQNYRATTSVNWTVISPSGSYDADGPRTDIYRIGTDEVLVDENGEAGGISHRDMAVAIVDEIETSLFVGKRMTVGY